MGQCKRGVARCEPVFQHNVPLHASTSPAILSIPLTHVHVASLRQKHFAAFAKMASVGLASSRLCSGLNASTSERSPACISLRRSSALRFRGSLSSVSQHSRSSTSSAAAQAPSSSTTLPRAIDGLSDQQRHQLAAEWGYEQLGTPLPSGITPAVLTQSMPLEVALIDEKRALLGVLAPIALMAAGYGWLWYMHTIIPGWQQALCWLMVGTGYFGLFVVAHDAARLALLPDNTELQNALGSLLMAPSLYSLEAWRVSLLIHYNQTNMLGEDAGAWQPLTKRRLAAMGKLQRQWAQLVSTTPLKLLGSICHWVSSWGNFDLKRYFAPLRSTMIASWSVPFWFMAIVWPALFCCGGFAGKHARAHRLQVLMPVPWYDDCNPPSCPTNGPFALLFMVLCSMV